MLTLLDRAVSGNCWRARLMLGFLGLDHQRIEVDILAGEQNDPLFLKHNPRAQIPVLLVDDPHSSQEAVWDSCAILAYLAARFGPNWLAQGARERALEQQFLSIASVEHQVGIRTARGAIRFGLPMQPDALVRAQELALRGLAIMDARLQASDWLAGETPTIADVACYPYARLAPEAGVATIGLTALGAWLSRFEALDGYGAIDAPFGGRSRRWSDISKDGQAIW